MLLDRLIYPRSVLDAIPNLGAIGEEGPNWVVREEVGDDAREILGHCLVEAWDRTTGDDRVGPPRDATPVPNPLDGLRFPVFNHYRATEITPGVHLVSVDTGQWVLLDDGELATVRRGDPASLSEELAAKLDRAFVRLTASNVDSFVARLASHYSFLDWGPTLHILVVARQCNLRCVYCQASSSPERREMMSITTALAAVDRAFETPSTSLTIEFQGGEPLLAFPIIKAAAEYARELAARSSRSLQLALVSNFTEPAREERLRALVRLGFSFAVSIDGPAELHDLNRGVGRERCFAIVEENVRVLQRIWAEERSGPPELGAQLTTTRASLTRARDIVDTYLRLGVASISVRPVASLGRGASTPVELHYDVTEYLDFWRELLEYVFELRERGLEVREASLELILKKLFSRDAHFMDLRSPCGAAFGQVAYDTNGEVYTCDEGRMLDSTRFRLGNVRSPLADLLHSPAARRTSGASTAEASWCDHCAFKPFCGVCPVLNHAEGGSLIRNVLSQRRCLIQAGMIRHVLEQFATNPVARRHFATLATEA